MAIPIHVVYVRLETVDPMGDVVDKNRSTSTLQQLLTTHEEHRVQPSRAGIDQLVPNAADQPDIPTFLAREATDGYILAYQNQRMLVLYQEASESVILLEDGDGMLLENGSKILA